jgi:acyl-CoA dehydrogenase
MGALGGDLKRKEKLTGRFADIFSWMYLGNAVLARFENEGRRKEDLPFMRWAMEYAFFQMQQGFDGLYENFDIPVAGAILRGPVALWSRTNPLSTGPSDRLSHQVARAMQVPGPQRERHTSGLFVSDDPTDSLGRLEHALRLVHEASGIEGRIKDAVKDGRLPRIRGEKLVTMAVEKGVITTDEAAAIERAEAARLDAIQVDSFSLEEYMKNAVGTLEAASGDGAPSGDGGLTPPSKGQAYGAATYPEEPEVKPKKA